MRCSARFVTPLILVVLATAGSKTDSSTNAQSPGAVFAGNGTSPAEKTAGTSPTPSAETDRSVQPRRSTPLGNPFGIEVQADRWWVSTVDDHSIYGGLISDGSLARVAGTGAVGYSGDGGPAEQATFNWPHEVRCDVRGNLYIADTRNHAIRMIDAKTGHVETIAGNGQAGFAGDGQSDDGQSGDKVQFNQPHSVVLDGRGGLLVADTVNHRIRRIDLQTRMVETIAGTGERKLPSDGSNAKTSPLFGPRSLAVDEASIWIALREGNSIWRIDRNHGTLHRVAGTGSKGYTGDGGRPELATFKGPKGLTIDSLGRLLVVDTENHAVRRIDLKKETVETVMGGTRATETFRLKRPHGINVADDGRYLLADSENHRVVAGD